MRTIMVVPFLLLGIALSAPATAGLAEDYRERVETRQSLEAERRRYEASLAALSAQIRSLNMVFFQCVSLKEKDFWEARINEANAAKDRLEAERQALAEVRDRVDRARQALETRRQEIEAAHTRKGPGTPYETDFREYMAALESDYFTPLREDLFQGYEKYQEGIRAYIELLKDSVSHCMKRDGG